jgi:heavy metal sensor kinase
MRIGPSSVRWRLTLWYAMLLAIPLVAFAIGSRVILGNILTSRADDVLTEARGVFLNELNLELGLLDPDHGTHAAEREVTFSDMEFFVYDAKHKLLAASDEAEAPTPPVRAPIASRPPPTVDRTGLAAITRRAGTVPKFADMTYDDRASRVLFGAKSIHGRTYTVAAVQSREGIHATLTRLTVVALIAIPLLLIAAAFGGYALARRALEPVTMMSRQARIIGATNLHERLPVPNPGDELGELALMVNELLQRLEHSFEQQRRFVANASHELRTPVAIVRAESEVALSRETRTETQYRDTLRVVHDAADRLSRIVHDLFLLARADAGHLPMRSEPLYLDEMVVDVARSMRALAGQSGIRIEVSAVAESPFTGDAELLGRMLLNLLDNAVKYSEAETVVHVGLERNNGTYRLSVADQGPGIPVEAQSHLFERFFRVDRSRERHERTSTSGAGLGLAIAQLVAEAHGGKAELARSGPDGSEFAVTLPVKIDAGG